MASRFPVPKGVKAEMVEQQLKNVTADPSKATKEQKAEAEETVEKELRDQMGARRARRDHGRQGLPG